MIPFAYVTIEAIPLTIMGRWIKSQLPAPEVGAASTNRAYVAPHTPQEKIMADIFAEVLRIEQVGVTDNLFELGADSLHVFQITSRAPRLDYPLRQNWCCSSERLREFFPAFLLSLRQIR